MLVLCVRMDPEDELKQKHTCFVWKGYEFDCESYPENSSLSEQQFVAKCIENYWGDTIPHSEIRVLHEDADDTSDDFNHFFGLD